MQVKLHRVPLNPRAETLVARQESGHKSIEFGRCGGVLQLVQDQAKVI
jgi:hypothetical protein